MAAASAALSLCISNLMNSSITRNHGCKRFFLCEGQRIVHQTVSLSLKKRPPRSGFYVFAVTKGSAKSSDSEETLPSWAKPDSEEPPPWAKEEGSGNASQQNFELPFFVYLLSSAIVAIAAIGSAFEYVNQKPVFGILSADSVFYAPVLGFFAFTGIPTSAFLWFKSVQAANKEAEEQDRRDGFK